VAEMICISTPASSIILKRLSRSSFLWSEDYLEKLGKLGSQGTEVAKGINQSASKEDLDKRFKI
jgi:hypothetical protein